MPLEDEAITAALTAIMGALSTKAVEITPDRIKEWFSSAGRSFPNDTLSSDRVAELADDLLREQRGPFLDAEMTRRDLARWFEVPEEEFSSTRTEQLEPEVLIRHILLEKLFSGWLEEWGYNVAIGVDLEGEEGVEYTPDVYGTLETLHGTFQVAVNFVCDSPPSINRVRALLETIESFTARELEFGQGDIFILATPFQFGQSSSSSLALQAKQEPYTVIKLEMEDLWDLQTARDSYSRQDELSERVRRAVLNRQMRLTR